MEDTKSLFKVHTIYTNGIKVWSKNCCVPSVSVLQSLSRVSPWGAVTFLCLFSGWLLLGRGRSLIAQWVVWGPVKSFHFLCSVGKDLVGTLYTCVNRAVLICWSVGEKKPASGKKHTKKLKKTSSSRLWELGKVVCSFGQSAGVPLSWSSCLGGDRRNQQESSKRATLGQGRRGRLILGGPVTTAVPEKRWS